nr:hypothetical protein [Capillimicrobium parvum]
MAVAVPCAAHGARHVGGAGPDRWKRLGTETLRALLGRECVAGDGLAVGDDVARGTGQGVAAWDTEVAGDGDEAGEGASRLHRDAARLAQAVAAVDERRPVVRQHVGGRTDDLGRQLGDRRDPIHRVFGRTGHEVVEPDGLAIDERPVVHALVDDDVDEAEGERAIRTGTDLQEHVRLVGLTGTDRIDHDELRALSCPTVFGLPKRFMKRSPRPQSAACNVPKP